MSDPTRSEPTRSDIESFTHDGPGTAVEDWRARAEWDDVPALDPLDLLGPGRPERVVVCAAHPDDESLGAGGLVWMLGQAGIPVSLLLATAGEGSHPRSATVDPTELAARRRVEADRAWAALGGSPGEVTFCGFADGGVAAHEDELVARLVDVLDDARRTLLITPWRHDGHPDHDALGRAGATAAYRTGARLLQYPVWFWHRAGPDDAPWPLLARVLLTDEARGAKARAVASHRSQVAPLSDRAGDETLLGPGFLAHFAGAAEVYVQEVAADDSFERLHREHDDPWGTQTRWYEQRKRELVLAMLPRRHYERGLDVGCSTGTMTQALAPRCTSLVAVDRSARAVAAARERLGGTAGVEVRELDVPTRWPDGDFDLVVVSESGYFFSPVALDRLVERVAGSMARDGSLVLAHWRHPIHGWPRSGPAVHAAFLAAGGIPPVVARYQDRDVEIVVHGAAATLPEPGGDG